MKKDQKKELLEKNDDGLKQSLSEQQRRLFDLRSQAVTEKLEDPSQIGDTKRQIARIKTIQRQRQLAATK